MKWSAMLKTIVIGAIFSIGLPAWANIGRCEQSFAQKKVEFAETRSEPIQQPQYAQALEPRLRGSIVENSLKESFKVLERTRSLIHQTDGRLRNRNLIVENGGLCASTCGVNVLHAVARYTYGDANYIARHADAVLHEIVDTVWEKYSQNARLGLNFHYLKLALKEVAKNLGLSLTAHHVELSRFGMFPQVTFSEKSLQTDENTIALLVVRTHGASHAIVLTGYDPDTKTAYFNDPNFPWKVSRARVTPAVDVGRATVKLNISVYGSTPDAGNVIDIIYVSAKPPVDQAVPAQYKSYLGKRVLIQTKFGNQIKMNVRSVDLNNQELHASPKLLGFEASFGAMQELSVAFDQIESIEQIAAPDSLAQYTDLIGKTVRAKFELGGFDEGLYEVTSYLQPSGSFPNGALKLRNANYRASDAFAVPFDAIVSIDEVH